MDACGQNQPTVVPGRGVHSRGRAISAIAVKVGSKYAARSTIIRNIVGFAAAA